MHTQTPPMPHPQAQPARRIAGFTLMEVLVALGLFTLGFVAIAALLPAGALLQRETADDIQSRHLERNAFAMVASPPILELELYDAYYPVASYPSGDPGDITDLRSMDDLAAHTSYFDQFWTMADRSYSASSTDPAQRSFYWLPLVRDNNPAAGVFGTNAQEWQFVVFVLRRDDNVVYSKTYEAINPSIPGLAKMGIAAGGINNDVFTLDSAIDGLRVNDLIVDNQGMDYRVVAINGNEVRVDSFIDITPPTPTTIWYAPPGADVDSGRLGRSPAVRVLRVTGAELNLY